MKGAIIQPSFLPWRGFFDIIRKSNIFVFLDDVQYDKNSWRNRNKIKTSRGTQWITVPVLTTGRFGQKINETEIRNDSGWRDKLLHTLYFNYRRAPFFDTYFPVLQDALTKDWALIADLDIHLTLEVMRLLGIETKTVRSSELKIETDDKNERIVHICRELGIQHYLSGPAAKKYMSGFPYENQGISIEFMRYDYPPYDQLHGTFEPQVSIIDLLFNKGGEAPSYIWNYPKAEKN